MKETSMAPWITLAVLVAFAAGLLSGTLLRRRPSAVDEAAISGNPSPIVRGEERLFAWPWSGQGNIGVALITGLAVLGLVGLYASVEAPEPTSGPSSTSGEGSAAIERLAALSSDQFPQAAPSPAERSLPSVDEMIQRLVARLKQNPNDPEGWRMLGWSYFNTEHFDDSAAAYLKAVALRPDSAAFRSLRGEALVKAANGAVTPEAAGAFDEALKLDPAEVRARFYKGLVKEQSGDHASALDDWTGILKDADPNEPFLTDIRQRAAELGRQIGIDVSGRLPDRQAAASGDILRSLADSKPTARPNIVREGPSAEDVRAAQRMPPTEQSAMIRGMVEGLAARLEKSPRDVDGWIKLIRSRVVLGETDQAKHALDRALAIFDGAPQEQGQITAAAHDLGLSQ
jgi:cytochrome c-type biogenesis protein CcmH